MEKIILNIDSRDVTTNNTNSVFWNFEPFTRISTRTTHVEPTITNNPNVFTANADRTENFKTGFKPIKNTKSIKISNIKWFYIPGGVIPPTTSIIDNNLGMYRFMRINSIESLEANNGSKHTFKLDLYNDGNESYLIPTNNKIEFTQPMDLKKLNIQFFLPNNGNPIAPTTNPALFYDTEPNLGAAANNNNASFIFNFTLEIEAIPNSISKSYAEMFNYSDELLKRMAYTKMIDYYDKESKKEKEDTYINNLAANMNNTMTNIHNQQEFQHNGQRINYGYNGFMK